MQRILLVDDEISILRALERELLRSNFHQVEMFTSPTKALARVGECEFEAIFADFKMTEMDGITFLEFAHKTQPQAARVLMSGLSDQQMLVNAVNRAHILFFLSKPWELSELQSTAEAATEMSVQLRNTERMAIKSKEQERTLAWQWDYIKRVQQPVSTLPAGKTSSAGWANNKIHIKSG